MIRNLINETYLKGFVPELTKYLWTGETTYDKQKQAAEIAVANDFVGRGYKLRQLMPALALRASGTTVTVATTETAVDEDIANRIRTVIDVKYVSGTATVNIQGTDVDSDTREETDWVDIKVSINSATAAVAIALTTTAETTGILAKPYKYYRCKSTGIIDYDCSLVEIIYDLFYSYKWLAEILYNQVKVQDDQFHIKAKLYDEKYSNLWASAQFYVDKDDSGDLDEGEQDQTIVARISH